MRILITGGAGFIGSHLAAFHVAKGDEVTVIDNLSTGSIENLTELRSKKNFIFIKDDLSNFGVLKKLLEPVELVYHFAAKVGVFNVCDNPLETMQMNVQSTYNLFSALKNCSRLQRIFFASTSEVYGKNCDHQAEDSKIFMPDLAHPTASYAISKIAGENIALTNFREHGLPMTILRLFNMIGPRQTGQYGMVVPRFVKQAIANKPITIFGEGNQTRSFCDIRDFLQMIQRLNKKSDTIGKTYNIGCDKETSIGQLATLVKQVVGSHSKIIKIPYEEAYKRKYVDTMQRVPDLTKLQNEIHYQHQFSLADTIEDVMQQTYPESSVELTLS